MASLLLCSIEYIELFLAVTYIGGIIAPLNYRWVIIQFLHLMYHKFKGEKRAAIQAFCLNFHVLF
jgi:acyl-CoA synthetase (AMP-forming)/AMP-acid ligase II